MRSAFESGSCWQVHKRFYPSVHRLIPNSKKPPEWVKALERKVYVSTSTEIKVTRIQMLELRIPISKCVLMIMVQR